MHHVGVVPHEQHSQPLPELAHSVPLLLTHHPGQLPPQLGEHIQCGAVPPSQGVDCHGAEVEPLLLAAVMVLPQLGLMGVVHSMIPLLGDSHHKTGLQGVDDCDVECCVPALRPVGEEDVCRPVV